MNVYGGIHLHRIVFTLVKIMLNPTWEFYFGTLKLLVDKVTERRRVLCSTMVDSTGYSGFQTLSYIGALMFGIHSGRGEKGSSSFEFGCQYSIQKSRTSNSMTFFHFVGEGINWLARTLWYYQCHYELPAFNEKKGMYIL